MPELHSAPTETRPTVSSTRVLIVGVAAGVIANALWLGLLKLLGSLGRLPWPLVALASIVVLLLAFMVVRSITRRRAARRSAPHEPAHGAKGAGPESGKLAYGQQAPDTTPWSIIQVIRKAPAIAQDAVSESYLGTKVKWKAKLTGMDRVDSSKVLLSFSMKKDPDFVGLVCEADLNHHRVMRRVHTGDQMWVEGVIERIAEHTFTLRDCSYTLAGQPEGGLVKPPNSARRSFAPRG